MAIDLLSVAGEVHNLIVLLIQVALDGLESGVISEVHLHLALHIELIDGLQDSIPLLLGVQGSTARIDWCGDYDQHSKDRLQGQRRDPLPIEGQSGDERVSPGDQEVLAIMKELPGEGGELGSAVIELQADPTTSVIMQLFLEVAP
ncbi:Uncharacterised protein [uncultured archaeon]|nr:Uncharacterised protein [uncultured archaeon]